MPAFDPVRDAVANSPRTSSYPLLSPSSAVSFNPLLQTPATSTASFPFPSSAALSQSQSQSPPQQPQGQLPSKVVPNKRSSLSMLLNDEHEPPRKTPRLGIAGLLSPAPSTEVASPLSGVVSAPGLSSTSIHHGPRPGSSSSTGSQPHPLRSSFPDPASDNEHRSASSQSPSMSPARVLSVTKPSFTPPRLPYNPRRITPAGSVLRPLTQAELATWVSQNPLRNIDRPGQNTNYNGGKDPSPLGKRTRDGGENAPFQPPAKRSKDAKIVAQHYNARPEVGLDKRRESPIIGLKSFNNWVKSVLIGQFAVPALQASPNPASVNGNNRHPAGKGKVLDMGCGKGGDLQKWAKARVASYAGLDIAGLSVDQAFHRWEDITKRHGAHKFEGEFATLDCYMSPISEALPPRWLQIPFDVVSMQFCMHYALESESKVRIMLDNVTRYLREGGVFIGTIPNSHQLMERLNELPADAAEFSWGNGVYKITFNDRIRKTYGQRYSFYLKDAVEDVPEYVVHWDEFERLASTYGLALRYKKEFHEVFEENHEHAEYAPLLQRMKVVDENGESQMDEDQWDAANVYIAFAFEKV